MKIWCLTMWGNFKSFLSIEGQWWGPSLVIFSRTSGLSCIWRFTASIERSSVKVKKHEICFSYLLKRSSHVKPPASTSPGSSWSISKLTELFNTLGGVAVWRRWSLIPCCSKEADKPMEAFWFWGPPSQDSLPNTILEFRYVPEVIIKRSQRNSIPVSSLIPCILLSETRISVTCPCLTSRFSWENKVFIMRWR